MKDVLQESAERYEPRGRLDPVGFAGHVDFKTVLPPPDLEPFVEHFWIIQWERLSEPYRSEEVMHRPYVDLFLSSRESGVQGTFRGKRLYIAEGTGRILGARFRPGAFHAIWPGTMTSLQDRTLSLDEVFPSTGRSLISSLDQEDPDVIHGLVDFLRSRNPQPDPNILLVNRIIDAVGNGSLPTVTAVAEAFGRSDRWIQQLFQEYLGIGAKWLIQRHRLLAAAEKIREAPKPDWAALAYDLGYSSQQHFITDFKQVVGRTPVQYHRGLTRPTD